LRRLSPVLLAAAAALTFGACTRAAVPPASAAPAPALGLSGPETYRAYLAAEPRRYKLRHQVESSFGGRDEVLEGFLVVELPGRFFVAARAPLGPALFEVKAVPGRPLEVHPHLPQLEDGRMARYLARDIVRAYLRECPADAPVSEEADGFAVSCALTPDEEPIPGDDGPDDALTLRLDRAGRLRQKSFARAGAATATVTYRDDRRVEGVWLAHRLELTPAALPYRLTIVLVSADLAFDTSRVFPGVAP
jgi:hypothetical protein